MNSSITFNKIKELESIIKHNSNDYNIVLNYFIDKEFSKNQINYTELLNSLFGVFPIDLFNHISEEQKERIIYDVKDSFTSDWDSIKKEFRLPPEHLANYEWRFSKKSAKKILSVIKLQSNICCLGTPSVVLETIIEKKTIKNITLLDINEPLISMIRKKTAESDSINVYEYNVLNILDSQLAEKFDAVIINPPWYLDYYKAFIYRSIQLLKNTGKIIMPIFPILSRQNAIADLIEIHGFIKSMGFTSIKSLGFVDFEMPEFEKEIFENNNVLIPPLNWRKSELIELSFNTKRIKEYDVEITDYVDWERIYDAETQDLTYINRKCLNNSELGELFVKKKLNSLSRKRINNNLIAMWKQNNDIIEKSIVTSRTGD